MPYQITVRTPSSTGAFQKRGLLNRLKAFAIGFVVLCVAAGVLIAAFVLGVAIAGLILLGIVIALCALWISRIWRRRA